MAFEPFPRDAVESLNDTGFFFIRENGKLCSPPGYKEEHESYSQRPQILSCFTKGVSDGAEVFRPKSLFQIMVEFVAVHLDIVDSFFGFPDQIGRKIFDISFQLDQFGSTLSPEKTLKRLKLFCNAYPMYMLSALSFQCSSIIFKKFHKHLLCFMDLTELDLSSCGIDDEDGFLPHIGINLACLRKLILRDNFLSNVGVQRLTASSRVLRKEPLSLEYIDLSGNVGITERSLKYLYVMKGLKAIDLSGCNINKTDAISYFKAKSFHPLTSTSSQDVITMFHTSVVTTGWASVVIDQWKTDLGESKISPDKSVSRFYKNPKQWETCIGKENYQPSLKFLKTETSFSALQDLEKATSTKDMFPPFLKRKTFAEKSNYDIKCRQRRKKIKCKNHVWSPDGAEVSKADRMETDFDEDSLIKAYQGTDVMQKRTLLQALDSELD